MKAVKCDFCLNWFHCRCVGLTEDQYEHFKELGDVTFWFCKVDKKKVFEFIKKGKTDETILDQMKAVFAEMKTEVSKITGVLENKLESSRQSFADVLKKNNVVGENKVYSTRPNVSKGVVVAHRSKQMNSKDVERIVKEKVNLVNIKTGVSKLKHVNSGIYLATPCDVDVLQKEIDDKLGADFIRFSNLKNLLHSLSFLDSRESTVLMSFGLK